MLSKSIAITIVTPTFNRGYCIHKVFESLKNQTFKRFEWIIVDDGSTDDTENVAYKLISVATFPIKYIKQENGGKHSAVNRALKIAIGELFLIFDSDDSCTSDSLEFMFEKWSELSCRHANLAGITTLSMTQGGEIIGASFPHDGAVQFLYPFYEKYGINGDKWDIHSTKILRQFPFPEIEGQKFCPESIVWNRIGKKHKTAFFNKPTKIAIYLDDGLSKNLTYIKMKYPKISIIYYKELYEISMSPQVKFKAATNFVRFSLHDHSLIEAFFKNSLFCLMGFFLGTVLFIKDIAEFLFLQNKNK